MNQPAPASPPPPVVPFAVSDLVSAFGELAKIAAMDSKGGQKWVFSAARDDKRVVLKIFKKSAIGEGRTEREVAAVAKLDSNYVPKIHDHGRRSFAGQEWFYLVEEFIEGRTLRDLLREKTALKPKQGLELLRALLYACRDFERADFVHRDIKPDNLIIDKKGRVWVIDFGLARHLDMASLTQSDAWGLGSRGYTSPEQGFNRKDAINSRSDLFSCGVVVYEALAGAHPYARYFNHGIKLLMAMESQPAPKLTIKGDDGTLAEFISKLMSGLPSSRPQTSDQALKLFRPIYKKMTGKSA